MKPDSVVLCDICKARNNCQYLKPSNPTGELCPPMESVIDAPAFQWPRERYLEDIPGPKAKNRPYDADNTDMTSDGVSKGVLQTTLTASASTDGASDYEPESNCRSYLDEYGEDQDAKAREHAEMHNDIIDMPHATFEETRRKLIAAGAFFGVPAAMTALVLKVHHTTVTRTAKRTHPVKITISDD